MLGEFGLNARRWIDEYGPVFRVKACFGVSISPCIESETKIHLLLIPGRSLDGLRSKDSPSHHH